MKKEHAKVKHHMEKAEHHMGMAKKMMSKPAVGKPLPDKEKMMAKKGDKKGSRYP